MEKVFSLTPGFSPVKADWKNQNRFNGFFSADKPLKRLNPPKRLRHPAKAGC
jgi:hypothetical protein